MKDNNRTLLITRTSAIIALLIVIQAITAPMGNILITGSLVNSILIIAVMCCGVLTGISVAIVSPILARLIGIGPLWVLIPFISLGNLALVLVWHAIVGKTNENKKTYLKAIICAAFAKFIVIYIGVVRIAIPGILSLSEKQSIAVSRVFSYPQLITASLGGFIAVVLLRKTKPFLDKQFK